MASNVRTLCLFAAMVLIVAACSSGDDAATTTTSSTTTSTVPVVTTVSEVTSTSDVFEPTTTTALITTTTSVGADVTIMGGAGEGTDITVEGPDTFAIALGDEVEITVLSPIDDEIHVHGYDLFFDAVTGEMVVISFTADIPGIFEVELESNHLLLFDLEVAP